MYRPVAIAAILMALCQSSAAQSPAQLVDRLVQNELSAAKNDHSYWMYRATNSDKGKVEEVIETPEGWMRQLISINGKAPSSDEKKKNEDEIQKFLTDPNYRKQQHDKVARDGEKATNLLRLLPKAFIYTSSGKQGDTLQISFRPNPGFHPPSREAKVFHSMAGTLLIAAKEMRLQQLSGHLVEDVDFGGGILGKLKKGGNFEVDQAEVAKGHWEITKLDVHITGRAMFFATIKQQQHEMRSDFREVPPGTTLAKAAELLKNTAGAEISAK